MNLSIFVKPLRILLACLVITLTACYYDNEEDLYGSTTTTCDLQTVVKFSETISPLISSQCGTSGCHSTASKAAGISLGTYDAIKSYITSSKAVFLGSIKRESSYSPMPKGGTKLSDCNIQKIESWINAGMLNN
jgi:hypothetical protein